MICLDVAIRPLCHHTPGVSYTYDRLGRPVSAASAASTNLFAYYGPDLANETQQGDRITRKCDAQGRPSLVYVNGEGPENVMWLDTFDYLVETSYDWQGRIDFVGGGVSYENSTGHTYGYLPGTDTPQNVASINWPTCQPATAWTRAYEPRRDLITAVSNLWDTAPVSSHTYANDALGRRTARVDRGMGVPPMAITNAFGYNARSEVTDALMDSHAYTYDYDPIGNRLTSAADAVTNLYAANRLNQYVSVTNSATSASPRATLPSYDPDGNMLTNGPWTYTWDAENRMASACSNGVLLVTNVYDHQSRRIRKSVYATSDLGSPISDLRFLYDGWNVVRETVAVGSGSAQSVATNYYTWGLDLSGTMQGVPLRQGYGGQAGGVGGLLAVTCVPSGTSKLLPLIYYPLYDANGNVTAYLDSTNGLAASFEYDAFGNKMSEVVAPGLHLPFQFSTKYHDAETGLGMYQLRPYIPPLARWASRDPIEEQGDTPNLYSMIQNDPLNNYDALGLFGAGRIYAGGEWKWNSVVVTSGSKNRITKRVRFHVPRGHSDFDEYSEFDYVKQDTEWETSPWPLIGDPASHFQNMQQIERELIGIFNTCGKGSFESAMHKGQDVFTHWNKGYRWDPFNILETNLGLGHGVDSLLGINPDADDIAFEQAKVWTSGKLKEWHKNCMKCNGTWRHR